MARTHKEKLSKYTFGYCSSWGHIHRWEVRHPNHILQFLGYSETPNVGDLNFFFHSVVPSIVEKIVNLIKKHKSPLIYVSVNSKTPNTIPYHSQIHGVLQFSWPTVAVKIAVIMKKVQISNDSWICEYLKIVLGSECLIFHPWLFLSANHGQEMLYKILNLGVKSIHFSAMVWCRNITLPRQNQHQNTCPNSTGHQSSNHAKLVTQTTQKHVDTWFHSNITATLRPMQKQINSDWQNLLEYTGIFSHRANIQIDFFQNKEHCTKESESCYGV